jgi:hypothetical protein
MSRRFVAVILAVLAATGLLAMPPAAAEVRAATPNLTIVTDARYEVQPEAGRVRVTVDLTLANHLRDTTTKRYYFDRAFLSVLPGTSGHKLSWAGSGTPRARVSKATDTYTLLELDLAARIYSGKTAKYRLVFDLVDKGGDAARDVRIGASLVSFPVWSFATESTGGSTVQVTFPKGYEVQVQSGEMPAATTAADGRVVLSTGKLAKPLEFFAYLVADRPAEHVRQTLTADVGGDPVEVTIESWPDDTSWSKRVGGLVTRALPLLSEEIGLGWPREGGLVVRESVSRSTGGYAGLFDPTGGEVEVAYYADDGVVLHEAAHAWFNGALLADRWASEAFASYYGLEAAAALEVKASVDELTDEVEAARIPLNAWGPVGDEDDATEEYGYAASLALARAVAERAGDTRLRAVWADASGRVGTYQPSAAATSGPELVTGAPDWRGLLDLLETHSPATFDDLWRKWVARDADLDLLDARSAARARYDGVVSSAGEWELPRAVRDAMRAWRFDQATALLTDAQGILDQRAQIAAAAAGAGLTVPPTLEEAFEGSDGFATARLEAEAELDAIARYAAAVAVRPTGTDAFQALGMLGSDPAGDLERARMRFADGDLAASAEAATAAQSAWTSATDVGRGRAVSLVILAIALVLGLVLLASWLRGRRRRRHVTMAAEDFPV